MSFINGVCFTANAMSGIYQASKGRAWVAFFNAFVAGMFMAKALGWCR